MKLAAFVPWLWVGLTAALLATGASGGTVLAGAGEAGALPAASIATLAGNTAWAGTLAGFVALALGALPALVAARLESRRRARILLGFALIPVLVPPVCHAVVATRLTAPNGLLGGLGLSVQSVTGAGVVLGWAFAPIVTAVLYGAWRRCDPSVEEAALLESRARTVLWRVVLPQASAAAALSFVLVFLLTASDLSVAETLRGVPLLVREIYVQFGVFYNTSGALRAGFMLLVPCLILAGVVLQTTRLALGSREVSATTEAGPSSLAHRMRGLRTAGWIVGVSPALLLLGTLTYSLSGPEESFLAGARLAWRLALPELVYTLTLACLTACTAIYLSIQIAIGISRSPFAPVLRLLLLGCFLVPAPLLGVALKRMLLPAGDGAFNDLLASIDASPLPLVVAWLIRFVPPCALLMEWALHRLPAEWREAATLEGAGFVGHVRVWGFHGLWQPAAAVGLLVFTLCFQETGSALLLVPPGTTTLGVRLLTLLHYAPGSQVSALCLLLCLPAILAMVLLVAFSARRPVT